MSTTIDTMINELQTYIDALAAPLAGAIHTERLTLSADERAVAVMGHDVYVSETTRATNAIDALRALAGGSFPTVPFFTAAAEVDAGFDKKESEIHAFNAQVRKRDPPATQMESIFTVSDQPE